MTEGRPFPRLVSLEPSVTATLFALGREHLLVAGSEHDRRLLGDQVAHLPTVPSTWAVRAEDVARFQPDLVIASVPFREQSLAELLNKWWPRWRPRSSGCGGRWLAVLAGASTWRRGLARS